MKENGHISYLDIILWDQVGSHKKSNLYIHVMIKTVIMLCVGLFEIEEYWHYRCYNKSYLVTGMKHPESITTLFLWLSIIIYSWGSQYFWNILSIPLNTIKEKTHKKCPSSLEKPMCLNLRDNIQGRKILHGQIMGSKL